MTQRRPAGVTALHRLGHRTSLRPHLEDGGSSGQASPKATRLPRLALSVRTAQVRRWPRSLARRRSGRRRTFYHRALGFDKTVWSYLGAMFLWAGGYHHQLGTNVWAAGPVPTADQARPVEWTVVVPTTIEARAIGARLLTMASPVVEKWICKVEESEKNRRCPRGAFPFGTPICKSCWCHR